MSRLYEHSQNFPAVEGDSLPFGKMSHPLNPYVLFHIYVMINRIVKSLVI